MALADDSASTAPTAAAPRLREVSLDDKYTVEQGRIFLTGTQALVRLPLMQQARDKAAGLETRGFISGYRGSPLGAFDQQLEGARGFLDKAGIHFQPGVNEDLAATSVWGSQQGDIFKDFVCDGVFSIWYGKGPGLDRSSDAIRHANMAGTAKYGGVLAVVGDDHGAKSSTTAHQGEHAFADLMCPVLVPAGVQDILDFGLYGWAMSRFSGCWVGFKVVADTVDTAASVYADPNRVQIVRPDDVALPEAGLNIRWPDPPLDQEARLHRHKLYAALGFARANGLNKRVIDSPNRKFGIVTAGKAYLDVCQALDDLGIDETLAADIGLSVYKIGMAWPLEREGVRAFAEGLDEILVIEEKRAVIENQLKEQLYNWAHEVRPRVIGKFDEHGEWILPSADELTPARIARVIARRIATFHDSPRIRERLAFLDRKEQALSQSPAPLERLPYFCSGCPHNTSTQVPEGSRALAGIGCHYMVQWMGRNTETFTQMGGEGVPWIGQAPFSKTQHVFVNLGDGTYFHSGILAIRACIGAGVNITFKILYNDAVAMTGGQGVDGPLNPVMITRQLAAEGIQTIRVLSDQPETYPHNAGFGAGATLHHRDEIDAIQRELRETPGVSALVYDQTCAAENRRRRKRGQAYDPPRRVVINEAVCEGCGDCGKQSNCVSITPKETEFGTKRQIDQTSCNKDFSCLKGFCPSFVTLEGAEPRKPKKTEMDESGWTDPPAPAMPDLAKPWGIMIAGVGGTGVVTIGQILGMAAHLEDKGCTVLNQAGLAQKGGAVGCHVRIGARPEDLDAARISAGGADLLLGCDIVTAASFDCLAKVRDGDTHAVVDTEEIITGDFTSNPDYKFPGAELRRRIRDTVGAARTDMMDASAVIEALMGNRTAVNMFMLGYAYQKGLIPLSEAALTQAITLNGVAVSSNLQAFRWGRRAAHDWDGVRAFIQPTQAQPATTEPRTLDELIDRRAAYLTDYQDRAYAERYRTLVARARETERQVAPHSEALTEAVAKSYFKLLAIKDEYEVARLLTDPAFDQRLNQQFTGDFKPVYHLAPPILAKTDPRTGRPQKKAFGPWVRPILKTLARMKRLRGTRFDIFAYLPERKVEHRLIGDFEARMDEVLAGLSPANHATAVAIAELPQQIRGFGPVKMANLEQARGREAELVEAFHNPRPLPQAAE
jgi:indolepyruvate ferredoxin oxidoreductase